MPSARRAPLKQRPRRARLGTRLIRVPAGAGGGTTAPTAVTSADLVEGTGTRSFSAVTTQAGDYLVVGIQIEAGTSGNSYTPSATGVTFPGSAQADSGTVGSTRGRAIIWAGSDAAGGSRTVTITVVGTLAYRARLTVVRGSTGPSGSGAISTAQSVSLARTGDDSMVFVGVTDWSAGAVGSPTWVPGGTTTASQQGTQATYIFGRWDDSGPAGTASTGISTPTYTTPTVAALEMLGTAGGGGATVNGTASLTGAGTLSAQVTQPAAASLTGAGTLSAAGGVVVNGTASLTGTGTLSAAGISAVFGTATLTGAGTLAASVTQGTSATLSGAGALTAGATQNGSATLTGVGTLTAQATQRTTATLSGAGTLSAVGTVTVLGTASLVGAGTLTASTSGTQSGTATLTGVGTLTAQVTQPAAVTLTGAGSLTAQATQNGAASLTGAGSLTAQVTQRTTATLTGAGTLTAGAGGFTNGAVIATGAGTLAAAATVISTGAATLTGAGTVTAQPTQRTTAALIGAGTLAVTPRVVILAAASLTGAGALTAAGLAPLPFTVGVLSATTTPVSSLTSASSTASLTGSSSRAGPN